MKRGTNPDERLDGAISQRSHRVGWNGLTRAAEQATAIMFGALVVLMLTTPSWRGGTFTWLPIAHFTNLAGAPYTAGLLSLLPFAFAASWAVYRFAAWRSNQMHFWTWDRLSITVPLLLLTILGVFSLNPAFGGIAFIQLGAWLFFWLMYLYLLNERPNVIIPLTIVVLVQGGVALVQFLRQSDLGLTGLGELPLDPMQSGISVVFARDQRWLRGYGLTAHPNMVGAMLAAILLLLLEPFKRSRDPKRLMFAGVYVVGLIGLFASLSRAATLAYFIGLVSWWFLDRLQERRYQAPINLKRLLRSPGLLFAAMVVIVFWLVFGDIAFSRVIALDTQIEAMSVDQRLSDIKLALEIIGQHPIRGVGLGQYALVAKQVNHYAVTVHNVVLLVTAELGIGGLLALLWLTISGLRSRPAAVAPWLALLFIGLFDITLWLTGNWQTAVLLALIAANLSHDITNPRN